jgi:hypothetical protein
MTTTHIMTPLLDAKGVVRGLHHVGRQEGAHQTGAAGGVRRAIDSPRARLVRSPLNCAVRPIAALLRSVLLFGIAASLPWARAYCPPMCSCAGSITDCSALNLTSVPAGIDPATTSLKLQENQISLLPPGVFDSLTSLTWLDLRANNLTSLPPGVLDKLSALSWLDISANQLSTLPAGLLDQLPLLALIFLYKNVLSSLPPRLFNRATALTTIALNGNRLSILPAGIFDLLPALKQASLHDNLFPNPCPQGALAGSRNSYRYCELCSLGKYNAAPGSPSCANCPAGTFCNTTGLSAPGTACPAGRFSAMEGAISSSACAACTAGG